MEFLEVNMVDLEKVINGKASNGKGSFGIMSSNSCSCERCITAEADEFGVGIGIADSIHIVIIPIRNRPCAISRTTKILLHM